jgi:hypothetical protein
LTLKTVTPETVVAYEPISNHGRSGNNVLFGNLHVQFYASAADLINEQLAAKKFPVTLP